MYMYISIWYLRKAKAVHWEGRSKRRIWKGYEGEPTTETSRRPLVPSVTFSYLWNIQLDYQIFYPKEEIKKKIIIIIIKI